jgi:hypothetical protein
MAELVEDQYIFQDDGNRMVFAYLGAFATISAIGFIDSGNRNSHRGHPVDGRGQKNVGIGLLHIAIN